MTEKEKTHNGERMVLSLSGVGKTGTATFKQMKLDYHLTPYRVLISQPCPNVCSPMDCSPPDSSVHSPGKTTGVGSHSLLQRIFPT